MATIKEATEKLNYFNFPAKVQELFTKVDTEKISATKATNITALGTTTNLTAIAATYADLAAARTSVDTLKTDVEARLDVIEAKVDALIAALKTAGVMTSS